LGSFHQMVLLRLSRAHASAASNRQMVDILTAVLADGLPAVEAACAEAISLLMFTEQTSERDEIGSEKNGYR
jgi:hypothetical protein